MLFTTSPDRVGDAFSSGAHEVVSRDPDAAAARAGSLDGVDGVTGRGS